MKKHRVLRNLLIDAALAGAALTVFALFHHVLPRQQEGLGSVISNPYQTESPDSGAATALPENTRTAAGPGASDAPSRRSWRVILPPYSLFQAQALSRKPSRPSASLLSPSLRICSTTFTSVAIDA